MRSKFPAPGEMVPGTFYRFLERAKADAYGKSRGWFLCTLCPQGKPAIRTIAAVRAGKCRMCRSCASRQAWPQKPRQCRPTEASLAALWASLTQEQKRLAATILSQRKDGSGARLCLDTLTLDERNALIREAIQVVQISDPSEFLPVKHHAQPQQSYERAYEGVRI